MTAPLRFLMLSLFLAALAGTLWNVSSAEALCDPQGWFPAEFGVKDHTVFSYDGYTYVAAIYLPGEQQFAYARSQDLCKWETLDPILTERTPGDWDEYRIWAPHVFEENGTYFMYYTGVNEDIAQSILLATSTDPADPASWHEQGLMFQPSHPGAVWSPDSWSDNRDPQVVKRGGTYYLIYTGRDTAGGIVGIASASSPFGPWTDLGATLGPIKNRTLESPHLYSAWGSEYLVYHNTWLGQSFGPAYRTSSSVLGPWSNPAPLFPGWAHEFWEDEAGWHASYLTGYSITIRPLQWDHAMLPPQPYIGSALNRIFLPLALEAP